MEIQQHHGAILACRLVIFGNLGIGEAYSVPAITTRAVLDHDGNDLNDRQDFASRRVRLGSAFNLGDPLVQLADPTLDPANGSSPNPQAAQASTSNKGATACRAIVTVRHSLGV